MVKIVDGENTFEIVDYRKPQDGEWFLTADGAPHAIKAGLASGIRHILRPIAGPAARPEQRARKGAEVIFRIFVFVLCANTAELIIPTGPSWTVAQFSQWWAVYLLLCALAVILQDRDGSLESIADLRARCRSLERRGFP